MFKIVAGGLTLTVVALAASTAAAVEIDWFVVETDASEVIYDEDEKVSFVSPDATWVGIFIRVAANEPEPIESLYTSVQMSGGVSFTSGFSNRPLFEQGFGGPHLDAVAQPHQIAGEPDRVRALAYEAFWTRRPRTLFQGVKFTTGLIFAVSGPGSMTHFSAPGDVSVIDGVPATLDFLNHVVVVTPEPGSATLIGLGLAGLARTNRRPRRPACRSTDPNRVHPEART